MIERLFSREHLWVEKQEKTAKVGITDYAQKELTSIVFLNLPDKGQTIIAGTRIGDVESIKTISDLISPISGQVIEVNEAILDEPELLNENPYDNWLIKVEFQQLPDGLLDEKEYADYCNAQ